MPLQENALTTVKDLKAQCGLDEDDTSSDGTLELLINAASDTIESYCNRKFKYQEHTEIIRDNKCPVILKNYPVESVSEIWHAYLENPILSPTLDVDKEKGLIYYPHSDSSLKIKYIAGYKMPYEADCTLPAALQQACLIYAKQLLNETGEKTSERIGDYQVNYAQQAENLPRVVKSLIFPYKGRN